MLTRTGFGAMISVYPSAFASVVSAAPAPLILRARCRGKQPSKLPDSVVFVPLLFSSIYRARLDARHSFSKKLVELSLKFRIWCAFQTKFSAEVEKD